MVKMKEKRAGRVRVVYKKAKGHIKKHSKDVLSMLTKPSLDNPLLVGAGLGLGEKVLTMKEGDKIENIISFEKVKAKCSINNVTNPLVAVVGGILLKNPSLIAIGSYKIFDDPLNVGNASVGSKNDVRKFY